jgi:hypothetical protein
MRGLLLELGELELYEETLDAFGCARLSRVEVESYLSTALAAYDRALLVKRRPSPSDGLRLNPSARAYAAEGARDLIEQGYHREAMYWIWHFHTIAQVALEFDAPIEERLQLGAAYDRLLFELGVGTPSAVRAQGERANALAERVFALTDRLVEAYAV